MIRSLQDVFRQKNRCISTAAVTAGTLLLAPWAAAQGSFGPGMMGGGGPGGMSTPTPPQQSKPQKAKKPPGAPELHAASGGGESTIQQGNEPSLPADPLKVSDELRLRLGTDKALDDPTLGLGETTERNFYGLWYQEKSGQYELKTAFPLWFERTQPSLSDPSQTDRASLYGGIYYNRRGADAADDIVFPVFWNLRDQQSRTTIVGPLVNRIAPDESDNWLAPLYFLGTRKTGSYQIIPPLLTYLNHDDAGGFNLVGPAFCSWEGASSCFGEGSEYDWGLAPAYFAGKDASSNYRLIPPLLHYHSEDRDADTELTVWGPWYREHTEKLERFHLLPIYWSTWGKHERHTTLFPFFHYGWEKDQELFINPLYLSSTDEEGAKTFVTWGYASYRGRTELDMFSPLVWLYRDPTINLDQKLILPFYYSRSSPREDSWALLPLYGNFKRHGLSETTWITPILRHRHDLTGWSTHVHPFAFFGRDREESYSVLAPIFYDFSGPTSRSTVAFPLYWRFAKPDSLTQLVGNFLYTEERSAGGEEWSARILPAVGFGETPNGHWWNLLFGLVGYEQEGGNATARLLWIPIPLSREDD